MKFINASSFCINLEQILYIRSMEKGGMKISFINGTALQLSYEEHGKLIEELKARLFQPLPEEAIETKPSESIIDKKVIVTRSGDIHQGEIGRVIYYREYLSLYFLIFQSGGVVPYRRSHFELLTVN